jgi:hypothetical protein
MSLAGLIIAGLIIAGLIIAAVLAWCLAFSPGTALLLVAALAAVIWES